jgi:hypothetical protein
MCGGASVLTKCPCIDILQFDYKCMDSIISRTNFRLTRLSFIYFTYSVHVMRISCITLCSDVFNKHFLIGENVFITQAYACILKAHSHLKSGGSIWASLVCQCCFWIWAGRWVTHLSMWLLTLQLFENSALTLKWCSDWTSTLWVRVNF